MNSCFWNYKPLHWFLKYQLNRLPNGYSIAIVYSLLSTNQVLWLSGIINLFTKHKHNSETSNSVTE